MNITKLDVLDSFDEIKSIFVFILVGVKYLFNGKPIDSFPADLNMLGQVTVEYETLAGWKKDITQCRRWDDLPKNAQKYIRRIEEFLNLKVQWIGVGPSRNSMIQIF